MPETGENTTPQENKELQSSFPVSPIDIRDGAYLPLLQHVFKALNDGHTPSTYTFQALFLREKADTYGNSRLTAEDMEKSTSEWEIELKNRFPEAEIKMDHKPDPNRETPPPPNDEVLRLLNPDYPALQFNPQVNDLLFPVSEMGEEIIPQGILNDWPKGIDAFLHEEGGIMLVTYEVFKRLPEERKAEMLIWMLEANAKIDPPLDLSEAIGPYFHNINISPEPGRNYRVILDYLYTHRNKYEFTHEKSVNFADMPDLFDIPVMLLGREVGFFNVAEALEVISEYELEKQKFLLGVLVYNSSFVHVINEVRDILLDYSNTHKGLTNSVAAIEKKYPSNPLSIVLREKLNYRRSPLTEEKKERMEKVGKILLGIDPDDPRPFHTSLESTYKLFAFENYDANIAAQQYEENLLRIEISKLSGSSLTVADIASGTGRMIPVLGDIDNIKRAIEVDVSEANIEKAIKYAQENGISNIEFRNKSWDQMGIEPESVDFAFCLGRSLTLAETEDKFTLALGKIAETIKPGGTFIFDLPDPNLGNILLYRQKHAQLMERLGIPISWSVDKSGNLLPDVDIVIDGPSEDTFYNRYTPQIDKVLGFLNSKGFDTEIIDRRPIVGSNYSGADRNIYIRAIKKL